MRGQGPIRQWAESREPDFSRLLESFVLLPTDPLLIRNYGFLL